MAHIVIMGAGIGGMAMAYGMRWRAAEDRVSVVSNCASFISSRPIPGSPSIGASVTRLEIAPLLKKRDIDFVPVGVTRVHPESNELELDDGRRYAYDILVIATGPRLAFEEIEGLGPESCRSVCHVDHALLAQEQWRKFVADPGPIVVGAAQGASCFSPACSSR